MVAGTSEGADVAVRLPPTTPPAEGALGGSTTNGTKDGHRPGVGEVEGPDGNGHLPHVLAVGISTALGGMRHVLEERAERRPTARALGRGHHDSADGTEESLTTRWMDGGGTGGGG